MAKGHGLDCSHIPFEMPVRKSVLHQNWLNLTFMHWKVEPQLLQPHIPDGLELDLFEGYAYVGVIPFEMNKVRPRGLPWVPFVSTFAEFNVRTYVVKDGIPGVLFLTLDAQSRVTCFHAPRSYGLPYRYAKAKVSVTGDHSFVWNSKRTNGGQQLLGSAKAIDSNDLKTAKVDTLEYFLFERYSLYTWHNARLHRAYTHHIPWKFCDGSASIQSNTLLDEYNLGILETTKPEHIHLSTGVKVQTWHVRPVNEVGSQ